MTNKKQRVRQAKRLRRAVKGLDLPTSLKLVKFHQRGDWDGFFGLLSSKGFLVVRNLKMVPCHVCYNHYVGRVLVQKNGRTLGVLDYHDGVVLP
ncbi:UNVERIFIED_ORG: hypothetical protein BDK47_1189 [Anoxybacillus amylolyticus]